MTRRLKGLTVAGAGALALLLAGFAGTAVAKDRNGDGLPDRWEKQNQLSLKVDQAKRDQDRDSLNNRAEFRSHTDPLDADSDDDGTQDGDEDRDHDGVDNHNEQQEGTLPNDKDSDDDGVKDGKEDADHDGLKNKGEDATANQPDDKDTDDDGIKDGNENAGMIAGLVGTTLTIDLSGGGQVSGEVTPQTEIKCETEDEHETGDDSASSSSKGSDDSGDDSGDDQTGEVEHGDEDNVCTTADLTAGTIVHEAELHGTAFDEIELVK